MRKTTASVVKDIYEAWRGRDLDWLATLLPENFSHAVFIPPKLHPAGGTRSGKQDAMARLRTIADDFDVLKFDPSRLMADKERAAVEIPARYRHRQTGVELESVFVNFWTFEGDWPVRLAEYHDIGRIQAFVTAVAKAEASRTKKA